MTNYNITDKLKTVSGITIVPFDKITKEIDWIGVEENINYLISKGVEVLVPCGNTSEFYSLTLEEAKQVIKKTVEIADNRALVMPGIGYSVDTAISLGNYASEVGADAVMIHMPVHPYATTNGVKQYFEKIINEIEIPSTIYFKAPHIEDNIILELSNLDKFVGVKYAINDLPRFAKIVEATKHLDNVVMICGTAEQWAPFFFSVGATGFTSGLVNVYPEKSLKLLDVLQKQDYSSAFEIWHEIIKFEDLRAKYNDGNNVAIIKESMNMLGLKGGITREPVDGASEQDKLETFDMLKEWGFKPEK